MKTKCHVPSCNNKILRNRGLCNCCYMVAYNLVAKGSVTWEKLEMEGKCTPLLMGKKRAETLEFFIGKK